MNTQNTNHRRPLLFQSKDNCVDCQIIGSVDANKKKIKIKLPSIRHLPFTAQFCIIKTLGKK
jgi:hypothetical protein